MANDEIAFDAVAVTRETRAAVGGMAALSSRMVAWIASLPIEALYHDAPVVAAALAYVAAALGGAALFRRASRIAVGLDGVLVTGTSRTRFFAYKDLDGARASGTDLLLLRGDRVALRLQLHGEDAARRDAVLERIRAAIAGASASAHDAKLGFVASASSRDPHPRGARGGRLPGDRGHARRAAGTGRRSGDRERSAPDRGAGPREERRGRRFARACGSPPSTAPSRRSAWRSSASPTPRILDELAPAAAPARRASLLR